MELGIQDKRKIHIKLFRMLLESKRCFMRNPQIFLNSFNIKITSKGAICPRDINFKN